MKALGDLQAYALAIGFYQLFRARMIKAPDAARWTVCIPASNGLSGRTQGYGTCTRIKGRWIGRDAPPSERSTARADRLTPALFHEAAIHCVKRCPAPSVIAHLRPARAKCALLNPHHPSLNEASAAAAQQIFSPLIFSLSVPP